MSGRGNNGGSPPWCPYLARKSVRVICSIVHGWIAFGSHPGLLLCWSKLLSEADIRATINTRQTRNQFILAIPIMCYPSPTGRNIIIEVTCCTCTRFLRWWKGEMIHPIYFTGNFRWRKISGKLSLSYHSIDDEKRYLAIAILFFVTVSSQLYTIALIPFFHGRCENEITYFQNWKL